jgi:hypothetical protein
MRLKILFGGLAKFFWVSGKAGPMTPDLVVISGRSGRFGSVGRFVLTGGPRVAAEWSSTVPRVRLVAVMGIIMLLGVVGCSAEADSGGGTPSPAATPTDTAAQTPAPTATTTGAADDITVRLNPDRVISGENSSVWILANCPVPTGGPDHRGAASSEAFSRAITLDPVPPPTATPGATAGPAPIPWVRGEAQVPSTVRAGTYRVNVTCEGTNDTGRADLRVAAAPSVVPTKAPRAGGGGMAAGASVEEESGFPVGLTGGVLVAAVLVGVILIARRRA